MPTAKKLPSGSWRCQVYNYSEPAFDDNGKPIIDPKTGKQMMRRKYASFTSDDPSPAGKREAEFAASEFAMNKKLFSKNCNLTFGQAVDNYIDSRVGVRSAGTIRKYRRTKKNHFESMIDIKIRDMTQEDIQAFVNEKTATHAPKTVRDMHGLISAVIYSNRPNFKLNTALPAKKKTNYYIPTDAEVTKTIKYLSDHDEELEIAVLLAAFGPMRRGEVAALKSSSINVRNSTIHVENNMILDDDNNWIIKGTKTQEGDRIITYPEFIIDKIKERKGTICNLNPGQITHRFSVALLKAGVHHFRFHDLRHYCASIMHALNVPDAYIMERGGWKSDRVLKEIYRHTIDEHSKKMNKKVNAHFETMQHEMQHEKK